MQKNYKLGSKPPNLMLTRPKIHLQQHQLIDSINKNMQQPIKILSQLFSSPRKKPKCWNALLCIGHLTETRIQQIELWVPSLEVDRLKLWAIKSKFTENKEIQLIKSIKIKKRIKVWDIAKCVRLTILCRKRLYWRAGLRETWMPIWTRFSLSKTIFDRFLSLNKDYTSASTSVWLSVLQFFLVNLFCTLLFSDFILTIIFFFFSFFFTLSDFFFG